MLPRDPDDGLIQPDTDHFMHRPVRSAGGKFFGASGWVGARRKHSSGAARRLVHEVVRARRDETIARIISRILPIALLRDPSLFWGDPKSPGGWPSLSPPEIQGSPARLAANTIRMFMNTCSRSPFAVPAQI